MAQREQSRRRPLRPAFRKRSGPRRRQTAGPPAISTLESGAAPTSKRIVAGEDPTGSYAANLFQDTQTLGDGKAWVAQYVDQAASLLSKAAGRQRRCRLRTPPPDPSYLRPGLWRRPYEPAGRGGTGEDSPDDGPRHRRRQVRRCRPLSGHSSERSERAPVPGRFAGFGIGQPRPRPVVRAGADQQ